MKRSPEIPDLPVPSRRPAGPGRPASGYPQLRRSLAVRLVLVLAMFLAVPVLIYDRLRGADEDAGRLLAASIVAQGKLAAEALRPHLDAADADTMKALAEVVQRLGAVGPDIKLLFKPAAGDLGFFYVAAAPAVPVAYLEQERQELVRQGVLDRLPATCEGAETAGARYTNPVGEAEVLTSVTAIRTAAGCWVVITAGRSQALLGTSMGQPYWQTAAVRAALLIYLAMAAGVMALLIPIWASLRRFGRHARALRQGRAMPGGFAELNRIPELAAVADELDRLVATLRSSADALRLAAQETAHAFKTPLGIISQSLYPLRARLGEDARGSRALDLIERALDRLDGLVVASQAIDKTLADTINPPRERVAVSELVADLVADYRDMHEPAQLRFADCIDPGLVAVATPSLLTVALQNLVDNAVSFSPPGGVIEVTAEGRRDAVVLGVADQGPGVDPAVLARIFDRFVTLRGGSGGHFGLGLWIVRRNLEAMGGTVTAGNRPGGGFRVEMTIPVASAPV